MSPGFGGSRAQALLELGLCTPVVILLALGTVAVIQVASARAGLEAATQAAADAAARAPDPTTAQVVAQQRFASVIEDYPVRSANLTISIDDFARSGRITATASAGVDLEWVAVAFLPGHLTLQAQAIVKVEPWRSHTASR